MNSRDDCLKIVDRFRGARQLQCPVMCLAILLPKSYRDVGRYPF
jgi:hypothetical protein